MNTSSSYYVLAFCEEGVFEAYPISSWSVSSSLHHSIPYLSISFAPLVLPKLTAKLRTYCLSFQFDFSLRNKTICVCVSVKWSL